MLWKILLLATIIETLVEVYKWTFEKDWNMWRIVALGLGVVLTPLTALDLFRAVDMPLVVPYIDPVLGARIGDIIGYFLTGALASRGSTVVSDFFNLISKMKDAFKTIPNLPTQER